MKDISIPVALKDISPIQNVHYYLLFCLQNQIGNNSGSSQDITICYEPYSPFINANGHGVSQAPLNQEPEVILE